jgi:hypothetical protein
MPGVRFQLNPHREVVVSDCITLRLTTEQQEQLRRLTGREARALAIATEWLDDLIVDEDDMPPPGEFEEFVWECLNPYP